MKNSVEEEKKRDSQKTDTATTNELNKRSMIVQKLAIIKKPVSELDELLEEEREFEEVVRMVPQHQLELYGAGRIDDSLSSASPASSSSSPYQLEDNNANFVFGSQLVDKNSITPYSDATQVSSLHFSYSLSLPLL